MPAIRPDPSMKSIRVQEEKALPISRREFLMAAGVGAALLTSRFSILRAEDQQRLRVGMIIPEQGPFAGEAKSLLGGFYLFLKEKGIDAANIEILKRDPGPDDAKAVDAVADLVMNQRVHVLIGPPSVGGCEKVIHGVEGSNVILFVTNPSVQAGGRGTLSSRKLQGPRQFLSGSSSSGALGAQEHR